MKIYNKKIYIYIIILIIFDQITKFLIYDLEYFQNFYLFSKVLNTWISWWINILSFNILIIFIPLILLTIIYFFRKNEIPKMPFMLILAWWIWNYIDRIFYWWVKDFIDLQFFPVFNVADILITFWMLMRIIIYFKQQ